MRTWIAISLVAACGHAAAPTPPSPHVPAATPPPASTTAPPANAPVARTADVVETLFGVEVHDPYRWMEGDPNAERDAWLRGQGARARAYLDALPGRAALFDRIRELGLGTGAITSVQLAGGRTFYELTAPGAQLPVLRVRDDRGDRTLIDPSTLGSAEHHASLNSYSVSPDGAYVAVDIAMGGGEISAIHVVDVASGKELPDVIEHVWGEFSASWLPDTKGFFYTQMAPAAEGKDPLLDMTARLHVLGTPVDQDVTILGRDGASAFALAPEEFPSVLVRPGTTWVVATASGAHSETRIAIAPLAKLDRRGTGKTPWKTVAEYADQVDDVVVQGDRIYLETFKDASNRKIVSVPVSDPSLAKARTEIAETPDVVLRGMAAAHDALFVRQMVEGRGRLVRLPWSKRAPSAIALPYEGWIDEVVVDPLRAGAMIGIEGWTRAPAYVVVDAKGAVTDAGLATTTNADFSHVVVEDVTARSADGTDVPMTIIRASDAVADGSHPALVYGYGGYGISITPSFSPTVLPWLEHGGVYAVCHVRGGGEKGYRWQADGTHEHKMNGVHDFEACGQALLDRKLTSPGKLFGRAGSMGGILIGRAVTDRPDLFAAANIAVGECNPIRLLAAENGANQKFELGDPETEAGFRSILAMDPYQHVAPGTAYPAVIFTIGLNDKRVAPWMTSKMAAKMLASTTSAAPVLVRIDEDAGHGVGSTRDQAYAERADVFAFFLSVAGEAQFRAR
ncbi:MAG TPA: prolyl oligopeptidase family serine peptidase [Kofleriaceae bacterium]|nr:prolyl oligopeptidase family serine peptidase [Kofleriaceae bacterium]